MTNDQQPRSLTDLARRHHEPPEVPRDRMWERIQAARGRQEQTPRTPWWQRRDLRWSVAVAAALTLGLVIGRGLEPVSPRPDTAIPGIAYDGGAPIDTTTSPITGHASRSYRLAARPVLARTEALLLQVRTAPDADPASYSRRARDLLDLTRLLLDSPAGHDPQFAPLLTDLELSLARVVQLADSPEGRGLQGQERRSLEDGLTRQSLLPRLRHELTTTPAAVGL